VAGQVYFHLHLSNSIEQSPSLESNSHSVKKLPTLHGSCKFSTVFTKACHCTLYSISWNQFTLFSIM